MAMMKLVENITEYLDNKKYEVRIFIDLKKAFDIMTTGFKDLKLSLNSSKTKFMLFGNREMFTTGDWKLIKYPMKEYLKRDFLV